MRNFKKFTAAVAATLMAASMVAPMAMNFSASATDDNLSITVTNTDGAEHTYESYQIFKGDYTAADSSTGASESFSNVEWGNGVDGSALLTALKKDNTIGSYFASIEDDGDAAAKVAEILGTAKDEEENLVFADDADATKKFVELAAANKTTPGKMSGLDAGYYLVVDSKAPTAADGGSNTGAKSRYMVKLLGQNTTITAKHSAPTVDKQVSDNEVEGGSWGETADHAINETYQYKLIATLEADDEYAAYETYKITFVDTLGTGVTFENIVSVKVGETTVNAYNEDTNPDGYVINNITNNTDGEKEWTLSIADIKKFDNDLTDGAVVEVIYNAHLNENATMAGEDNEADYSASHANLNDVRLKYSNNPNWKGDGTPGEKEEEGETPKDTVGVYTYQSENTKIDGDTEAPLSGAKFELYDAATGGNKIEVYLSNGVYYPIKNATGKTAVKLESGEDGLFKIKGLDVGTYYLEETDAPAGGYNSLKERQPITISAVHKETGEDAETPVESNKVSLTFSENHEPNAEIENNKGTSLPSTGGIGTTLFYLGGGAMVAVAGIFLITKKRMKKEEV